MRVLFVSALGVGHVFPIIPLAWALRTAGHEVLVATGGDALSARDAGLPVADAMPGVDMRAMMATFQESEPEKFAQFASMKITDLSQLTSWLPMIAKPLVEGTVRAADQFRPDVVVQSMLGAAGLVVGGRLGVPVIGHGFGFMRPDGLADMVREHMAEDFAKYDSTAPDFAGYVDVAPPSMLAGEPVGWSMRYVPYNGGGVLPEWLLSRDSDRPLVAVTLGTVAPTMNGLGPVERVIAAAPDVDADFVLALGGKVDLDALGTLPPNVRVEGWVPLNALMAESSLLIHHGGAGTAMTPLALGVPQLVVPSGADRYINAGAVHDRGAGLSIEEEELDARVIDRVLRDEKVRAVVTQVSAEIEALPSPATIATRVERFVKG
jgi:UDP:flavonoid glycosyltransferase YjiC (YdhE family)